MRLTTKILAVAFTMAFSSLSAHAQQTVHFGSAFVVPENSSANKVRIGGITVDGFNGIFSVDWALQPDYSLRLADGNLATSAQEALEQSLRNTKWGGVYTVNNSQYSTVLSINAVQSGYVGAEITHAGTSSTGSLTTRLGGEIIKQYLINGVKYDEDFLTSTQLASVANSNPIGYIVRIKRTRAISYITGTAINGWSTNREYRLTLNGSQLSGAVTVPGDIFGSDYDVASSGSIVLTKQ